MNTNIIYITSLSLLQHPFHFNLVSLQSLFTKKSIGNYSFAPGMRVFTTNLNHEATRLCNKRALISFSPYPTFLEQIPAIAIGRKSPVRPWMIDEISNQR